MGKSDGDEGSDYQETFSIDPVAITREQADLLEFLQNAPRNHRKSVANHTKRIYYSTKFEKLSKTVETFEANHRSLIRHFDTKDRLGLDYFSKNVADQFEEAQIEWITVLQASYDANFPDEVTPKPQFTETSIGTKAQLPTISIPTFSGTIHEWKHFRDLFKSLVHQNEQLPESHKFHYLLTALSGEARAVIDGIEICDADYRKAWKALGDVYNDKPTMFTHIMNRFMAIEPVARENPEQLRDLLKSTTACLKSLDSVGIAKENVDSIISYLLIRKLPTETLVFWEQTKDRNSLPSFDALKECIETRIRVSNTVAIVRADASTSNQSTFQERKQNNDKSHASSGLKKKSNGHHASSKGQPSNASSSPPSSTPSTPKSTSGRKFKCPVCNGEGHPLRACDQFLALSANDRKATISKIQHCMNCLAFDHQENKCRSRHTCFTCGERHHSLLHVGTVSSHTANHAIAAPSTFNMAANTCNSKVQRSISSHTLLATAIVIVIDVNGDSHALRALIDQGSDTNFITESTLKALQLPKKSIQATINGIGSQSQSKHITSLTLRSKYDSTFELTVEALVMGRITDLLPDTDFKPQRWAHLIDLTLADPSYHRTGRIDLVLGAEVLAQILLTGVRLGPPNTPVAQQTRFGWILSGKIAEPPHQRATVTAMHASSTIESLMERFISTESIDEECTHTHTTEEQWCERFFVETHRREETGRFIVRLPFRFYTDPSITPLGRSRDIAIRSLLHLERRFAQNPALKDEYSKTINEYLSNGRMQSTTSNETYLEGRVQSAYLPHHAVLKESSTSTKLRVVFDASRRTTTGKSLNDMLAVGPTIQNDIPTININWRFHRVGFTADIQKMYLQIKVDQSDVQYQRFLWRNDPSEAIQDFALNRLTFGTSCAPFMAIRAVNQLATESKSKYPEAATVMLNDAYVDDVISGSDDVPTAQKLQRNLTEMLKNGGFDLKKWATNMNELLETIPESDREIQLPVELNANDPIKALGIAWNTATDSFGFKSSLDIEVTTYTKRTALSTAAKTFDPIGLIAPIIVVAKILMAKVWAHEPKLNWDDSLPPELNREWTDYVKCLQDVSEIEIPRWIKTNKISQSIQLHGFADASELAYGAAVYIRTIDSNGIIHVHLIASKSKVTKKRALTIPRLELNAAELLTRLVAFIRKNFRHATIAEEDVTLWSDSEIVCYWIKSSKPLKTYVANRVSKIHSTAKNIKWRHVRTHDNPADLVSRGCSPKQLAHNSLWWHGPAWLRSPSTEWPISHIDTSPNLIPPEDIDLEHTREVRANVCISSDDIIFQFSDYDRLMRITALCKRFIVNSRNPSNKIIGRPTVEELQAIRRHWIVHTQNQHFHDEVKCLSRQPPRQLDHHSKLLSLAPFVDGNGILRVGGRIEASMLPYDSVHPIILPPNAHFSNLIIDKFHRRAMHSGPKLTSSIIRQTYWIVHASVAIRRRLRQCIRCLRQRAVTGQQLMGSLPPSRIRPTTRAFLHTGVDYCGPFDLRASKYRGVKSYKGYVIVFVCMAVKAVHLECVDGLTTEGYLAAFSRFVARRGLPSDMYSDNGTNFVGAANQIKRDSTKIQQQIEQRTADNFAEEGLRWHFIPPGAPHFGGLWESGVKSVKERLKSVVGESKLTFEQMQTLLCRIEACLNSRPLCAESNDPNDLTALTPGHFLVNSPLLSVPEPSSLEKNSNRLDHWQQIRQMRLDFWRRWRNDYLSLLMQRPKWKRALPNLKVGELVLVQDKRYPSHKWPLGRIIEVHPNENDEKVRVATIKTAHGVFKRDVTKISRLPIQHDSEMNEEDETAHQPNDNFPTQ